MTSPFMGRMAEVNRSSADIEAMSRFERDVLLDILLYTMESKQRQSVRTAYPEMYKRLFPQHQEN